MHWKASAILSTLHWLALLLHGCRAGHAPGVLRTPDARFSALPALGYPWQPKYLHIKLHGLPELRMHYIDEGPQTAAETILLLHGTPAWSFLWRGVIPALLKDGHRVIAPDFLGCGRSDKLAAIGAYSHALHVDSLEALVTELALKDVTVIGHDLGGPIGGSLVRRNGGNYRRIALLNTWFPQGDVFSSAARLLPHFPYLAWRVATRALKLLHPVALVFSLGSDAPKAAVTQGYAAPFPSKLYKAGVAAWPLMIPLKPGDEVAREMQATATFFRNEWKGREALLVYSSRELFTRPGQALLEEVFPSACRAEVAGAGHFLQEDRPAVVAGLLLDLVRDQCRK